MPELAAAPDSPRDALARLLTGYQISQSLMVAARLGIADLLAEGPQDCAALARATDTHAASLYRVLRLLASVGVFAEDDCGRFALTPMAEFLRSDVAGTLRPMAIAFAEEGNWRAWADLLHSVRTGEPAFEHVYGMGPFAYRAQHPEAGAAFDAFMVEQTTFAANAIVAAYDFAGLRTVMDVGGGRGALLAAVLAAGPQLRGVLFDQPQVVDGAAALLAERGVADRCERVGGDFFAGVPAGADLYLLQQILHDWDDARAGRILQCCHDAMSARGRLLVIERLIPPENAPSSAKLTDVNMLVLLGGRERTEAEYADLLAGAGLRLTRSIPTTSPYAILEAQRAD